MAGTGGGGVKPEGPGLPGTWFRGGMGFFGLEGDPQDGTLLLISGYCNLAYSDLAWRKMGMLGSGWGQRAKKSS